MFTSLSHIVNMLNLSNLLCLEICIITAEDPGFWKGREPRKRNNVWPFLTGKVEAFLYAFLLNLDLVFTLSIIVNDSNQGGTRAISNIMSCLK